MIVGVPLESLQGEQRVALIPGVVPVLRKMGLEVLIEKGAGAAAGYPDSQYEEQGAKVSSSREELFSSADIIVQAHGLEDNSHAAKVMVELLRPQQIVLGLLNAYAAPQSVRTMAQRKVTSFALELLPRISRAQPMDAMTSMASIAGYKAVVMAAGLQKRMFPMMITAAGTVTPARVFVIGAGVAGLQAIATARRMGATVRAYDVRPVVKEQVESLGAKFVEMPLEAKEAETAGGYAKAMDEEFYRRQRELMKKVVAESDVVITTAAIPGKKAPVLLTREAIGAMQPGSVVIDLAAETGGNCELTKAGETVEVAGVSIIGPVNLSTTVPYHASMMYAKNVTAFLQNLIKDGQMNLNMEDQIIKDTLLTHNGEIMNAQVRDIVNTKS